MDCDNEATLNSINKTKSGAQNGTAKRAQIDEYIFAPPDGGSRAWLVMLGSFFCNGILFGVINSYGIFHAEIYNNLINQNVTDASSKAGRFVFN